MFSGFGFKHIQRAMTTEREVGSTTGASIVLQVMVQGCFGLKLQSEVRLHVWLLQEEYAADRKSVV